MPANDRPPLYRWMDAWMGPNGPAPTTRHVLHVLASHMNQDGGNCWPGQRRLADETGLARKTVRNHLDLAREAGWLTWEEEAGAGKAWRQRRYHATYPPEVGDPHSPTSGSRDMGDSNSPTPEPKVGGLRKGGGGTEGGKVGDPDSSRGFKRDPRSSHGARGESHTRENGGPAEASLRQRAGRAWRDVLEAVENDAEEFGEAQHPAPAAAALDAVGGWEVLRRATAGRLQRLKIQFVTAFAEAAGPGDAGSEEVVL